MALSPKGTDALVLYLEEVRAKDVQTIVVRGKPDSSFKEIPAGLNRMSRNHGIHDLIEGDAAAIVPRAVACKGGASTAYPAA